MTEEEMTEEDRKNIRATYHHSLVAEALELLDAKEMADLPPALGEGLRLYLSDRIETGGFLRKCLENDFAGAVSRAHPSLSLSQFKLIAMLLSSGFPSLAWGSPDKVAAWLKGNEKEP